MSILPHLICIQGGRFVRKRKCSWYPPPSKRWTNKKCAVLFCLHLRNNLSKQELYLVPQIFGHHKIDESINTRAAIGRARVRAMAYRALIYPEIRHKVTKKVIINLACIYSTSCFSFPKLAEPLRGWVEQGSLPS